MPTGLDVQTVLEGGYSFTRHEISHLHANVQGLASPTSPPAAFVPPVITFGSFKPAPVRQGLVCHDLLSPGSDSYTTDPVSDSSPIISH